MSEQDHELIFTVNVVSTVPLSELEEEDIDVPGQYDIELPACAHSWPSSRQAKEVLDCFHLTVPIGNLDDFLIEVLNPQGEEIFEEYDEQD